MYNNYACTINGKHTYYYYGLYVTNTAPIAPPEVRTQYIEVPGRNGNIDLTDALTGRPVYGDREITLELGGKKPAGEWPGFFSRFLADVHGKKVEIVFDNDPGCYYVGRAIVSGAYERGNEIARFTVTVTAEPYKYARFNSLPPVTATAAGISQRIVGSDYLTVPEFTVTGGNVTLKIGDDTYTLTPGVNKNYDIVIDNKAYIYTYTGTGTETVQVSYKRGWL